MTRMSKDTTIPDEDLKGLFGRMRKAGRNQYITDCVYCGKQAHFYMNRTTQQWDCKKCGEEGNIVKLLHFLGKLFLLGDFKSIDRTKIKMLGEDEEDQITDLVVPNRRLPLGFKRVYEDEYLFGRRFTKENLQKLRVGYTNLRPFLKDYIIFAVDEEDGCKGYVARYSKTIPKGDKKTLRYRNDKGAKFSHLLFGYNEIIEGKTDTVILVEGLPDKVTTDNVLQLDNQDEIKCCCTFGKKISKFQILKLLKKGVKNIILIFDYDAISEMKKYGVILEEFFNVQIGFTFQKDINDSTEEEIFDIFQNLKDVVSFNRKTVKTL